MPEFFMSKLAALKQRIKERRLKDSDQPRDSHGRWSSSNATGESKKDRAIKNIRKRKQDPDYTHDAIMERGAIAMQNLDKDVAAAKTKKQKEAVYKKLKDDLIAQSGISKAEAKKLVGAIQFDKSVDKEKKWQARKIVTEAATEFYQLTGGGGAKTLQSFKLTDGRAYASREDKYVNIGYYTTKEVVLHEASHHYEFSDSRVKRAAQEWRDRQAESKTPEKLAKITGNSSFGDDEIAMRDKYLSPYTGKIYSDGYTEVTSMGVERLSTPESMKSFHEKAPKHFQFIVGLLTKPKKQ